MRCQMISDIEREREKNCSGPNNVRNIMGHAFPGISCILKDGSISLIPNFPNESAHAEFCKNQIITFGLVTKTAGGEVHNTRGITT